jgi:hypothetical protein
MASESLHVAVVDISKLANLGWVVEGPSVTESGTDSEKCIEVLAKALKSGPLALGFEAPMFVPYGRKRCDLDKAHNSDEDHAFPASVWASVLTKGLVIIPYIVEGLRCRSKCLVPRCAGVRQATNGRDYGTSFTWMRHDSGSASSNTT